MPKRSTYLKTLWSPYLGEWRPFHDIRVKEENTDCIFNGTAVYSRCECITFYNSGTTTQNIWWYRCDGGTSNVIQTGLASGTTFNPCVDIIRGITGNTDIVITYCGVGCEAPFFPYDCVDCS